MIKFLWIEKKVFEIKVMCIATPIRPVIIYRYFSIGFLIKKKNKTSILKKNWNTIFDWFNYLIINTLYIISNSSIRIIST